MNILESDDTHLRQLIFEKEKVIVKFVDESCAVCKSLAPSFERFAVNPTYNGVTFVRMHADQNPVSSKEVRLSGTPFFAIYRKGTIMECGLLTSEAGIEQMLNKLI